MASPNYDVRASAPDILLLHYTGMVSTAEALALLCNGDRDARVSCHYLVREDGTVVQLVPERARAWHAGVSYWEYGNDINSRSIGIEVANAGDEFGSPDFPDVQIEALIALSRDIVARHRIRADRVLAHSDVAPQRKRDPGQRFPWARLAAAGLGLWVTPAPITEGPSLAFGDEGEAVATLQRMLASYGYDLTPHGRFDTDTVAVVTAFQRHFRPARCDGRADRSTEQTLQSLIAARAELLSRVRR